MAVSCAKTLSLLREDMLALVVESKDLYPLEPRKELSVI
jgi:hypothetical protein